MTPPDPVEEECSVDPEYEQRVRQTYRACLVVCFSMPTTLFVFVLAGRWLESSGMRPEAVGPGLTPVFWVFLAAGTAAAVSSPWLRRLLVEVPVRRLPQLQRGADQWGEEAVTVQEAMIGGLYVATIVAFAIAEVPAVLGFVYFVMGGGWGHFAALAAPALLGWVANFPTIDSWRARLADLDASHLSGRS